MSSSDSNLVEFSIGEIQFRDEKVENLIFMLKEELYGDGPIKLFQRRAIRNLARRLAVFEFKDLSWLKICDMATESKSNYLCFVLLYLLLKEGSWKDPYKEHLMTLYPVFDEVMETFKELKHDGNWDNLRSHVAAQKLFCRDDIRKMVCFRNISRHGMLGYLLVETENPWLKHLIQGFFNDLQVGTLAFYRTIEDRDDMLTRLFAETIPDISPDTRVSERIFWEQVKMLRDSNASSTHYSYLFRFHIYLQERPMPRLFNDRKLVCRNLLESESLIRYCKNGFHFTLFQQDAFDEVKDKDRVVFILEGYNRMYNSLKPFDLRAIDCSGLKEKRYLPIFWRYVLEDGMTTNLGFDNTASKLIEAINIITDLKNTDGYPEPNPFFITRAECVAIKLYADKAGKNYHQKRVIVNQAKAFLASSEEKGLVNIEGMALMRLNLRWNEAREDINETVSTDELLEIFKILDAESSRDPRAMLVKTILRLLIDTEFRISMICALRTTDIRKGPSGEWHISKPTKTTHGKTIDHVITEETAGLLLECIRQTETVRLNIDDKNIQNSIFVYYLETKRKYKQMLPYAFRIYLELFLSRNGIGKKYTASMFRNTHMTKAIQYCLDNGINSMSKGLLTGHKSPRTTFEHYYGTEESLRNLLEATYDIEISADIKVPGTVIEGKEDEDEESSVENGCGACSATHCIMRSNLPCLLCRSFITTPSHLPFFEEAIRQLTKLMEETQDEHVIEDLKTRKSILVLYLEKIYEFKEAGK